MDSPQIFLALLKIKFNIGIEFALYFTNKFSNIRTTVLNLSDHIIDQDIKRIIPTIPFHIIFESKQ
jgi:hypothetical protein